MTLRGESVEAGPPVKRTLQRIRWQPQADGRVRQLWEASIRRRQDVDDRVRRLVLADDRTSTRARSRRSNGSIALAVPLRSASRSVAASHRHRADRVDRPHRGLRRPRAGFRRPCVSASGDAGRPVRATARGTIACVSTGRTRSTSPRFASSALRPHGEYALALRDGSVVVSGRSYRAQVESAFGLSRDRVARRCGSSRADRATLRAAAPSRARTRSVAGTARDRTRRRCRAAARRCACHSRRTCRSSSS